MAEPTIDQMLADFDAAAEAGDEELAGVIAAKIKAAQPGAYAAERQKDAKAIQAEQRSQMQKTGAGNVEGLKRIWEGIKQLGISVGEVTGTAPPGATEAMTQEMMGRRFEATGADPDIEQSADITEAVVSSLPGISAARAVGALPKLKKTTSILKTVGRGMAGGATAGLVSGADEMAEAPSDVLANHAMTAGIGAGFTGAMALAVGVKPLVHNYLVSLKDNADQNLKTLATARNTLDVGPRSLTQQSGNAVARNLEIQTYATRAQNFFNTQFERFATATEGAMAGIRKAATSENPDDLVTGWKIHKAWGKQKAASIQAANREYGGHISEALSLAARDNKKYPLPFDNLAETTAKWESEASGPWWRKIHPGASKLAPEFESLDNYLSAVKRYNAAYNAPGNAPMGAFPQPRIGSANEGISIQDMILARRALNVEDQGYWRAVNAGRDPTPAQLDSHRAVSDMKKAMDKDIDQYLASANPDLPSVQALHTLRDANSKHKQFWEMQDFMSQTTTAQWFGGRIADDPGKALMELARRSPAQQTILVNVLRSSDPSALADLRAGLVNQAMRDMVDPSRAAARGRIDPGKFGATLQGPYGTVGQKIFEPAQMAQIEKALNTVRVLANAPEGISSVSRAPSIESTAMALVSKSQAFLTRALVRISGLGKVEDLIFSDEGLRSLDVLDQVMKGTWRGPANEVTKAITKIGAVAATPEVPDEYVTAPNE